MARLIDADEMAANESEAYMKVQISGGISPITQGLNSVVHRKIQQLIADTPTVDTVEVKRCKGCKHWSEHGYKFCKIHSVLPDEYGSGVNVYTESDDFCSYGERWYEDGTK